MPRKSVKKEKAASSCDSPSKVHQDRVRRVDKEGVLHAITEQDLSHVQDSGDGHVVYWMSRDQRAHDNWALLFAYELAAKKNTSLSVIFSLLPKFLDATERQFDFMLKGLEEVEGYLRENTIPFHLLTGHPEETIPEFWSEKKASVLVTDFSPLRTHRGWVQALRQKLPDATPIFCVDAHNVVPVWITSEKQEYAARTIRPKIHKKLDEFNEEFPSLPRNTGDVKLPSPVDWKAADRSLEIDRSVPPLDWITPGYQGGMDLLHEFCEERLKNYDSLRNKPTEQRVLSNLSPYYHFGQIAPQRAVQLVQETSRTKGSSCKASADAYIEELLVRRELSDNYCFYQPHYDSLKGAPEWAQKTLEDHRDDKREHVYSLEQMDKAETKSEFWNAMQTQLVVEGKLHGFCRMQWGKNILEWTESPEEALRIAIYLNDRYNIDGRDPNGYVGCLWSVGGLHDQGWKERPIYGKVRYMNERGCRRKFDVDAYIKLFKNKKLVSGAGKNEFRGKRPREDTKPSKLPDTKVAKKE